MRSDKTLLVTGASSDIGIALVEAVIDDYAIVIAHYSHTNNALQDLKAKYGEKVLLLQADFSDEQSVIKMIELLEQENVFADHVVHLASMTARNLQFRKEEWNNVDKHIEVSVKSIYRLLKNFLPQMERQKYGKVVFMLTTYVVDMPPKFQSSYTIAKYSLLGLMKSLAVEYFDKGVTVNGVSPDMIDTKFLSELPRWIPEKKAKESALGRNLRVDDVVPVIRFLLSDGADTLNGQNIEIRN